MASGVPCVSNPSTSTIRFRSGQAKSGFDRSDRDTLERDRFIAPSGAMEDDSIGLRRVVDRHGDLDHLSVYRVKLPECRCRAM